MVRPLAIAALLLSAATARAGTVDDIARDVPGCPEGRAMCVGLALYVVVADGAPVIDPTWLAEQLDEANRQFAEVDVGFTIASVAELPASMADVETRAHRDRLGRRRLHRGVASVFVVRRLANVDQDGDINGVHWHHRANRERRWVILSSVARRWTLAHELGHFFGLPHSTDAASLMNTTRRAAPPIETRSFTPDEMTALRRNRDRLRRSGRLRHRRGSR